MALKCLSHCPLQTRHACGTSLPALRTSALPNNGCVMGRTTARMALTRACRSVVSALSDVMRNLAVGIKGHICYIACDSAMCSSSRAGKLMGRN